MTKSVKGVFVVLAVSSFLSLSFEKESVTAERLVPGDLAPELVLCNEVQPLSLHDTAGRYTLLSFWASYDAASRANNAALNHQVGQDDCVKMISVSFDRYASVCRASIRQDRLSAADCHVETEGANSAVYQAYHLEQGFKNYLLDSEGRVVAMNVTPKELASYLR
ncbi:MAG: thioredoxin family protein [Bacteroidales bacterium]|nr:thioredoxin family protein [Bacteroidales bacterium]